MDLQTTAAQCRHYAMCKIDYLGTGVCPSGPERHYVAYYPQGRMDVYDALVKDQVPLTQGLIDIAQTCTLCGRCDKQCHFVTGMRPLPVMRALKDTVAARLATGEPIVSPEPDPVLDRLREIVGAPWATNDPAILVTYAHDPFPLKDPQMPRYVVLPGSTCELAAVVKLARELDLAYVARGSGGSVFGMVFTDGIVFDMHRLNTIEIDPENWTATVGAGVSVFDLQQAAAAHGFRVNAAEPAATVVGNIICTGLFSPWSATYGTMADNFVDMEFVDREGDVFHLSDPNAPNLFAYRHAAVDMPALCARAMVRLHPTTDDEEALLVPFADFEDAVAFARELTMRRIGIAVGVLGAHYIATFISPSREQAERLKTGLAERLGLSYGVIVVADAFGRAAIQKMVSSVMDARLLRAVMLGLPKLLDDTWLDLLASYQGDRLPHELLIAPEMAPLVEMLLDPSPETAAGVVEPDLRDFYTALYHRPEYTDFVWLLAHRVISARMARHSHVLVAIAYVPLDRAGVVSEVLAGLQGIGDACGVDHAYGFLTPLDFGKVAVLEYDYYIDQTAQDRKQQAGAVMGSLIPWLDELALTTKGVTWIRTFFSQGCARKESMLYRNFTPRTVEQP